METTAINSGLAAGVTPQTGLPKSVPDPVVRVRPVASPAKFIDWRISQNLTDRWGEINDYNRAMKPLEALENDAVLLDRLREQMWDEICFIVRRDGEFGILFEVEFVSIESDGLEHEGDLEFKPICEMFGVIANAAMEKLVPKFPCVEFVIPDENEISNGRPALWAWVPDGLLNDVQRTELGMIMLAL